MVSIVNALEVYCHVRMLMTMVWVFEEDVRKVRIADSRVSVIPEHGVDGLRQLRIAGFLNTARVDPSPFM